MIVGNCRIEKILGAGGFGVTYKAWDVEMGKTVALKENFPQWLVQRDEDGGVILLGERQEFLWTLRHFIDEARYLSGLTHPNIVRVYRAFEWGGTAYFVMEYLEADCLEHVRARLPEVRLQDILTRLLDALSYMHGKGIYHRDIKPANIMLRRATGEPVFIDFGAAKSRVSNATYTRGFVSMGYTAPEQMADNRHLSPGVDIYSLGATFYYLLKGEAPPNASARMMKDTIVKLECDESLLDRYSPEFLRSIDVALSMEPERRHRNAREWLVRLGKKDSPPYISPKTPPVSHEERRGGKNRAMVRQQKAQEERS